MLNLKPILRMVPTFATAHPFHAASDTPRKSDFLTVMLAKTGILLRFISAREKQILARVIGIGRENSG